MQGERLDNAGRKPVREDIYHLRGCELWAGLQWGQGSQAAQVAPISTPNHYNLMTRLSGCWYRAGVSGLRCEMEESRVHHH